MAQTHAPGKTRMQAIVQDRYGSTEVLALRDIDRPVPKENKVLVRVEAAGLDRGVWHVMTGLPYLIRLLVPTLGLRRPKVPVLGMDLAGRVEAVGQQVTRFRPGDAVFGWTDGAYAQYASVPEDHLAAKPANLTFEQAAAVPISGFAALQAIRDEGEVKPGQTVLVIGAAGGVGSFAVQLAKAFGAQVTGVAGPAQLDLVRSIGADEVVDYTRQDVTDGSRHWEVIIDTAGHRSLSRLRRALSPRGTLVIVGSEGQGRWLGGFDRPLRALVLSRFVGQRLRMLSSKPRQDDLQTLRELIEAGKLTPVIYRTYPLAEVPRGHPADGGGPRSRREGRHHRVRRRWRQPAHIGAHACRRRRCSGEDTVGYRPFQADLSGRVALVTGANSGMGKETARELARMGAEVVRRVSHMRPQSQVVIGVQLVSVI